MSRQVTSCKAHGVTPLGCVWKAKPYGGEPTYLLQEVNAK